MTRGAADCRRELRRIGIEETETARGYSRAVEVISRCSLSRRSIVLRDATEFLRVLLAVAVVR